MPSLRPTSDRYTIYISASNFANQEINYSLQIASRYIRAEAEFNTSPSSIYNSNNTSYSSPANVRISSTSGIPRSAVVDKILTKGNVTSNETGRGTTAYIKVTCGSTTLYVYSGLVGYIENLTSQNISMYGTWNVSFLQHISGPCTFSNISWTFYYTYDVLNV